MSCLIVEVQRRELKDMFITNGNNINSLSFLMGFVIDILEHSTLYSSLDEDDKITVNIF